MFQYLRTAIYNGIQIHAHVEPGDILAIPTFTPRHITPSTQLISLRTLNTSLRWTPPCPDISIAIPENADILLNISTSLQHLQVSTSTHVTLQLPPAIQLQQHQLQWTLGTVEIECVRNDDRAILQLLSGPCHLDDVDMTPSAPGVDQPPKHVAVWHATDTQQHQERHLAIRSYQALYQASYSLLGCIVSLFGAGMTRDGLRHNFAT